MDARMMSGHASELIMGPVRAVVVAQQAGVETPGWLIALIGVVGVGIGGLMTLWGNHLSASREEKRRNQDRLWEEKRRNQALCGPRAQNFLRPVDELVHANVSG
jgi:hypothetical protein